MIFKTITVVSPGSNGNTPPQHRQCVRQRLDVGVEFVRDHTTKAPAPELRNEVNHLAFEHGLLLIGCGISTTRFIPPLVISRAEIDEGLARFEHALTLTEAELF